MSTIKSTKPVAAILRAHVYKVYLHTRKKKGLIIAISDELNVVGGEETSLAVELSDPPTFVNLVYTQT